jgi:hypothetical protein
MIRAISTGLILAGFSALAIDYATQRQWEIAFASLCLAVANAILLN